MGGQSGCVGLREAPARELCTRPSHMLTVVVVASQVLGINEEIVVCVQLPELAVNDVEVLVGEVLCQLVDVRFLLQEGHILRANRGNHCLPWGAGFCPATPQVSLVERGWFRARQDCDDWEQGCTCLGGTLVWEPLGRGCPEAWPGCPPVVHCGPAACTLSSRVR